MGEEIAAVEKTILGYKTHWFFVLLGIITILGIWWAMTPPADFDPDVQSISGGACEEDTDCTEGEFCRVGLCMAFEPDVACQSDADCTLIDQEKKFACCTEESCREGRNASTTWMAVGKDWFTKGRVTQCIGAACDSMRACLLPKKNFNLLPVCDAGKCVVRTK